MANSIPVGVEHYKKKGPPVNGQILKNMNLHDQAPICVSASGQSVLRYQEPFRFHLTITVRDKFRDLYPEINTGRRGKVPTSTGQGPRALKLQTLLSLTRL
jgi:hypothetical protein